MKDMLTVHDTNALCEVIRERRAQEAKWGRQDHLSFPELLTVDDRLHFYGIATTEAQAKRACDLAAAEGHLTYGHILHEEFAEVMSAANEDLLYAELQQLAAVCVGWMAAIDRRRS